MHGSDLMISVSGVRGIVGRSLTPELVVRLGQAFGTWLRGGRVVVGRDTRTSGEMIQHALLAGLQSAGCKVIELGVCATPTATLMVEHFKADGGVMVTASHNPIEWNALKFFRADGLYLNAEEGHEVLNLHYSGQFARVGWERLQPAESFTQASALHVRRILSIVDADRIRAAQLKVALDCVNGSGCAVAQELLEQLDCEVVPVHCVPDGLFSRKPEPTAANLTALCQVVSAQQAALGVALDPDGDRVSFVAENGLALGEEASLALCTRHVLAKLGDYGGIVVVNMSTSRVTEDVALAAGFDVLRTPAGEVHVAGKMKEMNAVFGGEGNGGVIDPRVHYGRDGMVGMALALEALALSESALSTLAAGLPKYFMVKSRIDCPPALSRLVVQRLRGTATGARVDLRDGLRLDWDEGWVQLRASNTEPILRIIGEARSEAQAQKLVDEYTAKVQALFEDAAEELARSGEEAAVGAERRQA